jgi:UDP-N-acetylglucosamine 4,6-dehydratase
MYEGKTFLITGGTGSFGNAVLNRLLKTDAREIRIFSRDEKKQHDMRMSYDNYRVKFYIGDVRNADSIRDAMYGVDYVFHAAALKQVPSCEFYPMEAIRTNALGTENALNAAVEAGVHRMIVLSTDKAVYPINVMGITKALLEKLMVAKSRTVDQARTILCGTRYGNVMGSRGSVIPFFLDLIRAGKPITVTDPHMTRFLLTLEDAVELVIFAFDHANSGDIFVQKAPACTIGDLAQAMVELFQSDSPIRVIGTRHGEKLHETLLSREEMCRAEEMDRYYRVPADARELNYDLYFTDGDEELTQKEDYSSHNTTILDVEGVKDMLRRLDFIQEALRERGLS